MVGVLTLLAGLIAIFLVLGAMLRIGDAFGHDSKQAGTWGVVDHREDRRRTMSTHEQRWQSLLVQTVDDDYHWEHLVRSLDSLEATAGGTDPIPPAPAELDLNYLNQRIARLDELRANFGSTE